MLDVHILRRETLPQAVWERCMASVASERARVHVLPAIDKATSRARLAGFSVGTAPFVTYVDDDDMVSPGLLDQVHDFLVEHPTTHAIFVANRAMPVSAALAEPCSDLAFTPMRIRPRWINSRIADHMWIMRRDHMKLDIFENYPLNTRGGELAHLRAYLFDLPDTREVYRTGQHYFWCGVRDE